MSPTALVLVLALFLAFAGWVAILIGRMLRDQGAANETAGSVLGLALLFAVASLLVLEFVLPLLEELLLRI